MMVKCFKCLHKCSITKARWYKGPGERCHWVCRACEDKEGGGMNCTGRENRTEAFADDLMFWTSSALDTYAKGEKEEAVGKSCNT